jgi:hypothetical protein
MLAERKFCSKKKIKRWNPELGILSIKVKNLAPNVLRWNGLIPTIGQTVPLSL